MVDRRSRWRGDCANGSNPSTFTFLGARVASLGDLNNDGKDDFVAGAIAKSLTLADYQGKVYIVLSQ